MPLNLQGCKTFFILLFWGDLVDRIGAPKELIHKITRKKKTKMKNDHCPLSDQFS